MDWETGYHHAEKLHGLGVDFIIYQETNFVATHFPGPNKTYQASKIATTGFSEYRSGAVKVAYQLSLTNQPTLGGPEYYIGDRPELLAHITDIHKDYEDREYAYMTVKDSLDGRIKPLLLFYICKGNNVYNRTTGRLAFTGNRTLPNVFPTERDFRPTVRGRPLRELFTVRYAVWAVEQSDYTSALEVWPFECMTTGSKFSEAGYASLHLRRSASGGGGRSLDTFRDLANESRGKPYLVVRSLNEFSTTDEDYSTGDAFTIEPNTQLHKDDGSPNANPWHMWDGIGNIINTRYDIASVEATRHYQEAERTAEYLRRIDDKLDLLLGASNGHCPRTSNSQCGS